MRQKLQELVPKKDKDFLEEYTIHPWASYKSPIRNI